MSVSSPHTAKTLVFTCMDERLASYISMLVQSFEGGAFHAAIAGGGAAFTTEPDRSVAVKQVVAAYKINRITDVYLQSHLDCGAYGLAGITFSSTIDETSRLYRDLDEAATMIESALAVTGAGLSMVSIHTQVVNVDGQQIERPQLTPVG
jgi:carbonic anhydrase